jgi:uncharacterized cupredoxin-like copper-binding protein
MIRRAGFTVLLLGAALLAACSGAGGGAAKPAGSGGAASSAQNVIVRSTDQMRFDPATLTVRANTPVTIIVDNSGSALIHDLVIDSPAIKIAAQAHSRASGTATFPSGTYQFYCSQPGHKEAGMVGTLIVS